MVTPEPGTPGTRARLASKLARLANRLPGTNVPGWNFGWHTRNFRMPAPHCSFFVYFSRVLFSRGFHLRTAYRQRRSTQSLAAGLRYLSRVAPTHLAFRARKSMKSPCLFRMRSTSTTFRCEKEVFTRDKLDALESG